MSKAKDTNSYTYDSIGNLLSVNYQGGGGFTNQKGTGVTSGRLDMRHCGLI